MKKLIFIENFVEYQIIDKELSFSLFPILFQSSMFIILAFSTNKYIHSAISMIFAFFLLLGVLVELLLN